MSYFVTSPSEITSNRFYNQIFKSLIVPIKYVFNSDHRFDLSSQLKNKFNHQSCHSFYENMDLTGLNNQQIYSPLLK